MQLRLMDWKLLIHTRKAKGNSTSCSWVSISFPHSFLSPVAHDPFSDISMPIMSGIESTRHIRRFEKENGLEPVALIALTGAANPNTRQEAFSSGVDLFLTKPVPMKALRGMLEDLRREGRAAFAG
jgi:CheY-like chemotaxis protein